VFHINVILSDNNNIYMKHIICFSSY